MSYQIPIYLINLENREDRLMKMRLRLNGLDFERINAIKKDSLVFSNDMRNGELSLTEIACIESHIKALETFLASPHELGCILEDDVIFGQRFFDLIKLKFEFPKQAYVIKLETFKQKVKFSNFFKKVKDFRLNHLHSIHYGTAAYLTSRQGAMNIIKELKRYNSPADHIIFEKMVDEQNYGHAYQLNPACCIQEFLISQIDDSNIVKSKKLREENGFTFSKNQKIYRECLRLLNNFCIFSSLFLDFLFRNQVFKKIEYED